ncbi:uncharacterized protein [Lepeophtheirus salmonis]|uniref:uncharacterized protein n=1 Tax=Lepeophtheirus salmonis TaxID=72036 RepID=UPI003AF339D0
MELSCEHLRANIFHNFRRELSQERIDEFKSLYGDEVPSYSTLKNWFNEFNSGQCSLKDEFSEGRPKTAVLSENIDAVPEGIMQNRHVTYPLKKVCSRWIPHNMTTAQKKAQKYKEMLKKYACSPSKDVYKIVTALQIMDLCVYVRNKTTLDPVGLRRRAKSNKSCSIFTQILSTFYNERILNDNPSK